MKYEPCGITILFAFLGLLCCKLVFRLFSSFSGVTSDKFSVCSNIASGHMSMGSLITSTESICFLLAISFGCVESAGRFEASTESMWVPMISIGCAELDEPSVRPNILASRPSSVDLCGSSTEFIGFSLLI